MLGIPLVALGPWKSFSPRCGVSRHRAVAGDQKASQRPWVYCPPRALVLRTRHQPGASRGYKYCRWSLLVIPNTRLARAGNEPRQLVLHPCSPAGCSCRTERAMDWKGKREKYLLLQFIDTKEDTFMAHQHTRLFCSAYFNMYRVCIQPLQL